MVIKPNILSQEPLTMSEVHGYLKKLQKEKGELNYRANKTFDYLNQLDLISSKETKRLFNEIMALKIPRLKEQHAKKIIDIMPKTDKELSVIFYGTALTLTKDNIKKIIDVINS